MIPEEPRAYSLFGEWAKYRALRTTFPDAAERGRLLSAQVIADDPVKRKAAEDRFGVEFCRANYPEAYQSGFSKILDTVRRVTRW